MIQIEICAQGRLSAENASNAGAKRIELCENLQIGGTTPRVDDIRYCVEQLHLRTHVLVRPRGGDFYYSNDEYMKILEDIKMCRDAGAHCVVVGFLKDEGIVHMEYLKKAVKVAEGMEVTFHRAIDTIANPYRALEEIIECGCHRILTSGCKPTAEEGVPTLRELVKRANGRIKILAGGGVTPENVTRIVAETGVDEIHSSCKRINPDGGIVTDADTVKRLIRNIKSYE